MSSWWAQPTIRDSYLRYTLLWKGRGDQAKAHRPSAVSKNEKKSAPNRRRRRLNKCRGASAPRTEVEQQAPVRILPIPSGGRLSGDGTKLSEGGIMTTQNSS